MPVSRYGLLVLIGFALLLSVSARGEISGEESQAKARIEATYRVDWAGMNLGEFTVNATVKDSAYAMQAKGKFSVLAGLAYRASGVTTSTGKLTSLGPKPSLFTLDYEGGDKKERRLMRFKGGTIKATITPPKPHNPRNRVPVTKKQLEEALDPLTATFLYARYNGPRGDLKVCHQTVPVYDGRQRFDIVLTPKRTDRLDASKGPAGLSGPIAVCQVKYKPLGGYKTDHPGVKFMSETDDIEVSLVPLPRTPLYVPYQILVPTAWGQGSVTLSEIEMDFDD
jgi:hypothetical protein